MSAVKAYYDALSEHLNLTDTHHLRILPWLICLHLDIRPRWLWSALFNNLVPDDQLESVDTFSSQQILNLFHTRLDQLRINQLPAKQQIKLTFSQTHLNLLIKEVGKDLHWLSASDDHHLIDIDHSAYPDLLKQISDPPFILYVKGQLAALNQKQHIAIVGARNATRYGKDVAYNFAAELANQAWVVNSGFALGIDSAAHQGALAKNGITLAVLGSGIDYDYPKAHTNLRKEICQKGALISEFPLETLPRPFNFPLRNRLISGMSQGVLVVEASDKSGSLLTAKMALEQNREVFAVPGQIYNPLAKGCHELIQQGAKLVCAVDDIVEDIVDDIAHSVVNKIAKGFTNEVSKKTQKKQETLNLNANQATLGQRQQQKQEHQPDQSKTQAAHNQHKTLSATETQILEHLQSNSLTVDELVQATGLRVQQLTTVLLDMELAGLVKVRGAYYQVV